MTRPPKIKTANSAHIAKCHLALFCKFHTWARARGLGNVALGNVALGKWPWERGPGNVGLGTWACMGAWVWVCGYQEPTTSILL